MILSSLLSMLRSRSSTALLSPALALALALALLLALVAVLIPLLPATPETPALLTAPIAVFVWTFALAGVM